MFEEDRAMTIQDLSNYLQINPLALRRLAREKRLPVVRIGRQWRTLPKIIDAWFERESMKNVADLLEE